MSNLTRRVLLIALPIAWCFALIAARSLLAPSGAFRYLVWNLFLAAIPAAAAAAFGALNRSRAALVIQLFLVIVWILFLPNAPYIVTDFIHLALSPHVPLWYDIAILISCAATGLLLAYSSVADVQSVVTRHGHPILGRALAVAALFLSGFGIYLGRFLRWNSWDAIARPGRIARVVTPHATAIFDHPRTIAVTIVYGTGLVIGYVALRAFAIAFARRDPAVEPAGDRNGNVMDARGGRAASDRRQR